MAEVPGDSARCRLVLPGVFVAVCAVSGALGPLDAAPAFLALATGMIAWGLASGPGLLAKLPALAGLPAVAAVAGVETRLALMTGIAILTLSPARVAASVFVCGALAWRLAVTRLPACWMAANGVSAWMSTAASAASGHPLDLGPAASGLDLMVLLAIGLAAGRPGGLSGTIRRSLGGAAVAGLWLVLCASGVPARAGLPFDAPALFNMAHEHLAPAPADVARVMLGWLPVAALAMAALLAGRPRRIDAWGSWMRVGAVTALSALLAAALCLPLHRADRRRPGDILLLKSPAFDLDVPRPDRYGIANAGMFGLLGRYLALDGHRLRVHVGPLAAADLTGVSVIVAPVPTLAPSPQELRVLGRFVESGGSLLVLTDHTDLMGTMKATNALTGRWGIPRAVRLRVPGRARMDRLPGLVPRGTPGARGDRHRRVAGCAVARAAAARGALRPVRPG